ncbi:agmatine deiminase family protein [Bacillus thuringiensis]|uniref:Peptidylarginine deiminase n=1 Tax=Bacillus thuringiensis TaxID=1428 RepID=A0A9X6TGJ5_BACTU|nr:agmatine deiminase family protein [Bacillus thuringiensis]PEA85672.1 peptidylarginine deiminase [Bacillus thuringiensis]
MNIQGFRTVGEFEKQDSVLMAWSTIEFACKGYNVDKVSLEIVRNLYGNVHIIICCDNVEVKQRAINKIKTCGMDIGKIQFIIYPTPIPYPRDFGAEVLVNEEGERLLTKFKFNTYGIYTTDHPISKLLEEFSEFHAKLVGVDKIISTELISEGGDREFNGMDVMMAIEDTEINKRNPHLSKHEVEEEFKRVFNLKKIIWLPLPTFDDENIYSGKIPGPDGKLNAYRSESANGHVDEMCRFVNENTILMAHISEEEAKKSKLHALNKERLDKAYEVLRNEVNIDGKPFKIVKMPVPESIYLTVRAGDDIYEVWQSRKDDFNANLLDGSPFPRGEMIVLPALSYCNFLITNNIVIAQKYYSDGLPLEIKKKDEEALNILKTVFPDRKVVAINTLALNLYGGGIHCNTRNIPAV